MAKLKWRGVSNPNAWFHHPRAYWSNEPFNQYKLSRMRRWYMALHDPIYVGMWVTLVAILALTAWVVLSA